MSQSSRVDFILAPTIETDLSTEIRVMNRTEGREPLGAAFSMGGSTRRLCEAPLSVDWRLRLTCDGAAQDVSWTYENLLSESNADLRAIVNSWTLVFDEIAFDESAGTAFRPWSAVTDLLAAIEAGTPECSLIVVIAKRFLDQLPTIVRQARKILLRREEQVELSNLRETGRTFLGWYVRSMGDSIAEKAGSRRRVPGIIRIESYDTLENRVLKDFLVLCEQASDDYLRAADKANYRKQHDRLLQVRQFRKVCAAELRLPLFAEVKPIVGPVSPNYVLQFDPRYRELWPWYQRLRQRKRQQDQSWAWQGRVWRDVMRLLVGAAFAEDRTDDTGFQVTEIKKSFVQAHGEQIAGRRLHSDSLPGPLRLRYESKGGGRRYFVADFVDSERVDKYRPLQNANLSVFGGHLYVVVTPLGSDTTVRKLVLVVWALNRVSSESTFDLNAMEASARRALQNWETQHEQINVHGIVLVNSSLTASADNAAPCRLSSGIAPYVLTLQVSNHPRQWRSAVAELREKIRFFLELACDAE